MQFFPLRLNFFVFLFLVILIYRFAQQPAIDTSSFHHFLALMSKIGFVILVVVFVLSLLSAVAACLYFIRHRHFFNVQIIKREKEDEHSVHVKTTIEKIVRPLLGNISVRYLYNETELSPQFILSNKKYFSVLPEMGHESSIELPNIKEYNLEGALLSFQDLFRFFSFTFKNSIQSQFINLPYEVAQKKLAVEPKTTQTDEVRTNTLRKISGEWLEYKKYEATDDIRRIVWKAYARNRELIIRQQEVLSPFASHINCYISFYNDKFFPQNALDAMSDFYKNYVWSFYKEISATDFEIKLHFDQFKLPIAESSLIAEQIAQANWQDEQFPNDFFDPQKGSVLFLHSLIPSPEMEKVLANCTKNTLIIYIDVTAIFEEKTKMPFWKKIFLKPKNIRNEELVKSWRRSPNRFSLKNQLEEHQQLLQNTVAQIEIIS